MSVLLDFMTAYVYWFALCALACFLGAGVLIVGGMVEKRRRPRVAPRPRSVDEIAFLDRIWQLDSAGDRHADLLADLHRGFLDVEEEG